MGQCHWSTEEDKSNNTLFKNISPSPKALSVLKGVKIIQSLHKDKNNHTLRINSGYVCSADYQQWQSLCLNFLKEKNSSQNNANPTRWHLPCSKVHLVPVPCRPETYHRADLFISLKYLHQLQQYKEHFSLPMKSYNTGSTTDVILPPLSTNRLIYLLELTSTSAL